MSFDAEKTRRKMTKKKELCVNALKTMAIAAMTIDLMAWTIWPNKKRVWYIMLFHIISRITAAIMWFFDEGCHYMHDRKRYLMRLLVSAVIPHYAYCFAFDMPYIPHLNALFDSTSVIWGFPGNTLSLLP